MPVTITRQDVGVYDPERGYPTVVPYLLYSDPSAAVRWLTDVLGFREVIRFTTPDGVVGHAELERGGHIVAVGVKGTSFGTVDSVTLVFVDDVDGACDRAVTAGGSVVAEARDQPWGLRQAVVADPEGQRWEVSQHLRDVPPEEWGAQQLGPVPG
jgi:uncharacterized glyoxalase superfamily protein PhnB